MDSISLFASGCSVLNADWQAVRCTVICTTNYPVSLISPDYVSEYHFALDRDTVKWCINNRVLCGKRLYINAQFVNEYTANGYINRDIYAPYSDTTFLCALQFLRRWFCGKRIIVYGLDFVCGEALKWYDKYIAESNGRGAKFNREKYEHRLFRRTIGKNNQHSFRSLFEEFYKANREWLQPIEFRGLWQPLDI